VALLISSCVRSPQSDSCIRTVEERIDQLIDSKRRLSEDLLEGGADILLTEMKDDDLLKLVALDLHTASAE